MSKRQAPLGMALFLLSEAIFFFMLILAFVYFRDARTAAILRLRATAMDTAFLVASTFTMWQAVRMESRSWLAATIALGSIFLIGQGSEYIRIQNLPGTAFFMLTSLHGLHLLAGIVLLSAMLVVNTKQLGVAALYWYFVAAVWIAIFMVVYL